MAYGCAKFFGLNGTDKSARTGTPCMSSFNRQTDLTPGVQKRRWREYCDRIEYTANCLWSRELTGLHAQRPTRPRQSGVVHSCSDVVLPDYVHNTLALGPKFAVDRERSAPELLSMVCSVAGRASEDSDKCISEGVDVLLRATLYKHRYERTRVIFEAAQMARQQVPCISKPSVALSKKELRFLEGRNEAESPLRLLPSARKEALRRVGCSRKKRVRPPPTERTPYAELDSQANAACCNTTTTTLDTHEESVCPTFHCRVAKLRRSGCIEAESTDYA
ncbi:hypothetical protein HPB51_024808 [Rhipicephalus microplus]|uniref:Uncharacterized protein n=1 Tax=Rhipicephalus microplus TaxID=6941 RepID=A0A9J6F8Q8_RHIMP|nr:hypothetical protein HPB51_024808 [Rhipicephalus microplus]